MSITDELREYASFCPGGMGGDALRHIADRIDAEHERGMADAELCAAPTEAQLSELGWVKLPVDADGVPIHMVDEMEADGDVFNVMSMELFYDGSWSIRNEDGNAWAACDVTHHEPDSWERIIQDATAFRTYDKAPCSISELVERCERLAAR